MSTYSKQINELNGQLQLLHDDYAYHLARGNVETIDAITARMEELDVKVSVLIELDVDDPEPEPEPPAPLPSASIGQVGHARQLDRRPFAFRKSPKMREYSIAYHGGDIMEISFNGVISTYENSITGKRYDIDFSVETVDRFTYVTLWVNRQYHACHVLEAHRSYYKLYSRIDKSFNENIAVELVPTVGSAMQEAYFMLSMFRDSLIQEVVQAKTVTIVTPVEVLTKPVETDEQAIELSFRVGDTVLYKNKQCPIIHIIPNGQGGQVYIGIKIPVKVKKGWSSTIIFRPASEFIVSYQAVA